MGNGDALELMKAAHQRSKDNMEKHKECTPEGHASLVDAAIQSQSDSEIIYFALQEIPEQVLSKLNGQKAQFRKEAPKSDKKDTTKFELGKLKVSTNSAEVASSIMRLVYLILVTGSVYFGFTFLKDLKSDLMLRVDEVEAKAVKLKEIE